MLALFDYLHVRALFTTKDAMYKALKSTELNDALQKRIQVHAASRAELQEGLKAAFLGYGHGGGDVAGAATGWNDEVPDDAGACNVYASFYAFMLNVRLLSRQLIGYKKEYNGHDLQYIHDLCQSKLVPDQDRMYLACSVLDFEQRTRKEQAILYQYMPLVPRTIQYKQSCSSTRKSVQVLYLSCISAEEQAILY